MITGTSLGDACILTVSAAEDEFEEGISKEG
jgi:elongation factor 1-alpha